MARKTSYKMKPPLSVRENTGHPQARDLVCHLPLHERSGITAFDATGRNHTGTLTGGATRTIGKFGRAVDLDGTDGHIEIADHADFTPALHPFSISADVYMHDATWFTIASKGVFNVDGEWFFALDEDDKLLFAAFDESVADCLIGRTYATALTGYQNQWVHLVGTYDGGTLSAGFKLYLNATRIDNANYEANQASFVSVENLAGPVWIGRYSTSYANGLVDNVMFHSRVLTPSDIVKLYVRRFSMFNQRRRLLAGVT